MKKVIFVFISLTFTTHIAESGNSRDIISNKIIGGLLKEDIKDSNFMSSPIIMPPVILVIDSLPHKRGIKILPGYSRINSIWQLLNLFKGRPVLIDLWASWCTPCKQEFNYSDSLHLYLDKKGIEIIYISFDKDEQDSTWRNVICKYDLSGNHFRANKALQDDLTILVWGAKDAYSIPRYLLFDKDKKLIEDNVPAPSKGLLLYEKIEEKLNSK